MFRRSQGSAASIAAIVAFAAGGCGSDDVCGESWFATEVVEVNFGPGQAFGRSAMPEVVLGPPQGGGCCAGSVDVASLGNGGSVVLGFDRVILDGPGADFVVFENAFEHGDGVYTELATVAVSADGITWHEFPCTATAAPFGSCAGWNLVHLDGVDGPVVPSHAGGDPFDLAAVGLVEARYVRITDRPDIVPADQGSFDLDAVGIVHGSGCVPDR